MKLFNKKKSSLEKEIIILLERCAMSSATLKMGVENMIKHYFPEVKLVEGIDDPNSNVDPYY